MSCEVVERSNNLFKKPSVRILNESILTDTEGYCKTLIPCLIHVTMAFQSISASGVQPPAESPESTRTWTFSQFLLPLRFQPLPMGVIDKTSGHPARNPSGAVACPVWASCSFTNRLCTHRKCLPKLELYFN